MTTNSNYINATPIYGGTDTEKLRVAFEYMMRNLYAALPVRVIRVKYGGLAPVGFVDIQPLPKQIDPGGQPMDYPMIANVPYFRLQGGKNAIIIDPQEGDIGVAVFSSRDISGVKRARGEAVVGSYRRMNLSDAIYSGGILNQTPQQYVMFSDSGITVYSPTKITCVAPDIVLEGANSITADTPLFKITGQMVQTGAKGSGAQTQGGITNTGGTISSNGKVLETHVHSGVQTGGGNTGQPV
nr:MAG TPA: baseplate protein [Caudoviricetes sp.]